MQFAVELSHDAIADLDAAFEYYNEASYGLGYDFVNVIDNYLNRISQLPTASAIRYENVRVKPVEIFPFTIHYIIQEDSKILVLRIFNTWQKPFWKR
jgi:plasmid stabilization system protein ParE